MIQRLNKLLATRRAAITVPYVYGDCGRCLYSLGVLVYN
jgi:hypothetical protein